MKTVKFSGIVLAFLLSGCLGSSGDGKTSDNSNLNPPATHLVGSERAAPRTMQGLQRVSDEAWDETAVRQVLQLFAFGGHASDQQIQEWAAMPPHHAIEEILYTGEFHPKLSPVQHPGAHGNQGTLQGLSEFWSSNHPQNLVPATGNTRRDLSIEHWRSPERIWVRAAHTPGLNPVRQKIGLYLTNYHLAVNQDAGVNNYQMLAYYDQLMNAIASDQPFEKVLTLAAASAAIAVQYNHRQNRFVNGSYRVNDDFAREYFQLFFGILSESTLPNESEARDYHENTNIYNMARLLTEMRPVENSGPQSAEMQFDPYLRANDPNNPPQILRQNLTGNNALERLQSLAPFAIEHPDSLQNLPVMLVQVLADDLLTDHPDRMNRIRTYWQSLPEKNLMTFLKGYATSTDFHTPSRVKYYTAFDRSLILANRMVTDISDVTLNLYDPQGSINSAGFNVFRPHHDVFGAQTGKDAFNSSDFFLRSINRFTEQLWRFSRTEENNLGWSKDWSQVIPKKTDAAPCLATVELAEWLWQRFVADGLKYFGPLERVQVYAYLNSGQDAAYNWQQNSIGGTQNDSIFDPHQLTEGTLKRAYDDLAYSCIFSDTQEQRKQLSNRIGQAVNFIATTPYMFFQEGHYAAP